MASQEEFLKLPEELTGNVADKPAADVRLRSIVGKLGGPGRIENFLVDFSDEVHFAHDFGTATRTFASSFFS
jgi:hypothetical protein